MDSSSLTDINFYQALQHELPLQIVGAINPFAAMMAEHVGFKAIYLSGAGVANYSHGLPDLGITNLHDVIDDIWRITDSCALPLLVDADTGFGNEFGIARTVKQFIKAGAAALHIEDQVVEKRCGHRPNKQLVPTDEMVTRIKAAVDARTRQQFVIMARTDALANEGMNACIERAHAYIAAGADMIFLEAARSLNDYQQFCQAISVPVLANMTEFGVTPLFSKHELATAGIQLILYPLSAARAMQAAALTVYQTIRREGSQQSVLDMMQKRDQLYEFLDYISYENKL